MTGHLRMVVRGRRRQGRRVAPSDRGAAAEPSFGGSPRLCMRTPRLMTHAADFLMDARRALDAGEPRAAYLLATARPNDRDVILALAQQILATGDAPLALAIARRAVDLEPGYAGSLALLALAGAADFQPALGLSALLDQEHLDFDPAFARAWCWLLCGEIDGVLNFIEGARADLRHAGPYPRTRKDREPWLHYLEDCLARRVTVEEPADILKAWDFIQYGSVLLECCPDLEPGGGRFTATWKSYH